MTYRFVPRRLRLAAQLATLGATGIVGASILATPPRTDVKLSTMEDAMDANVWAYVLIVFSVIGFCVEVYSTFHGKLHNTDEIPPQWHFWVVSTCHIILFGVVAAMSVAALASVFTYAPWNFGTPTIGALLAFWHYLYVQRRPREPISYVD